MPLADFAGRVGEILGRADVPGQHPQPAREGVSFPDRTSGCDAALDRRSSAEDRGLLEWITNLIGRGCGFELFKIPGASIQANRDCLRVRLIQRSGEECHSAHAKLRRLPGGDRGGTTKRRGAVFDLAEAHEEDAFDAGGRAGQVQQFVPTSAEFAAIEGSSENAAEASVERTESIIDAGARGQRKNQQWCIERAKIRGADRKSEGHDPIPLMT
jgi:hypothetical protein